MKSILVKAPAKLNLALDIVGLDERNYHLMKMVMQTIDLYDTIKLERDDSGEISLTCNQPGIPCNRVNICWRCADALFRYAEIKDRGIRIDIDKVIPQQAGMAGGSADGAAVLVGMNRLYQLELSLETLCRIGAEIGADIPFCLVGGTARVEGIGELITPTGDLPDCTLLVVKPKNGISTQKAFAEFDQAGIPPVLDIDAMLAAIRRQDVLGVCDHMYNALEQVCRLPDIQLIKNVMLSFGAKGAMMTGSGSAVFGVFIDRKKAYDCELRLKLKYPETFLCRPISHGPVVVDKA